MKVDLVYTWVDKNEPAYQKRNAKYLKNKLYNGGNIYRGSQINEIIYSLRTVYKYLPWVNNIFIITDKQVPKGLNLKNKKIHIIDQATILPNKDQPCFNTVAIEACIYRIKGLSEYFLLACDDFFVGKKLPISYFFTKDAKPIYSVYKTNFSSSAQYNITIATPVAATLNKFPHTYLFSHSHNITPYRISHWKYMVEQSEYKNALNATQNNMFRNVYDVSRHLVNLYFYKKGEVILRKISRSKELYTTPNWLFLINFCKPNLYCINDAEKYKTNNLSKASKWLQRNIPEKSPFEI